MGAHERGSGLIIGSQAFGALARMVLVTVKKKGAERRILARAESNIAPDDGGFAYALERVEVAEDILTMGFERYSHGIGLTPRAASRIQRDPRDSLSLRTPYALFAASANTNAPPANAFPACDALPVGFRPLGMAGGSPHG
ncbi:hypothetical protein [Paraburkholderia sp. Ac-20347]|uniref:hypothetical protein n=1 Tax=Paraburkholderia sp. Ac-20347 TaxID=2703892 RepID=UPI001980CF16|nr:hypothetical protein [Paraburkholderia sp. Ac-20347]MBN3814389.1 hypothetical protein [Paraburkholderia sp. Ac-20347]